MKFLEAKILHVWWNKMDLSESTSCKTNEIARMKILQVRFNKMDNLGNNSCKTHEISWFENTSCKDK